MTPALFALLQAVRAAAVALVLAIDAFVEEPEPEPQPQPVAPCEHPQEKRRAMMGKRFVCTACNTTVN